MENGSGYNLYRFYRWRKIWFGELAISTDKLHNVDQLVLAFSCYIFTEMDKYILQMDQIQKKFYCDYRFKLTP
jgi:hypothetical protein